MQKWYFLVLALLPLAANAQTLSSLPPIDDRLYEAFDTAYLQRLQHENTFLLAYYNFFLDHSYEIVPAPIGKTDDFPVIPAIDEANFNVLQLQQSLQLTRNYAAPTYYRIAHSDKLLKFIPEADFAKKLNQHLHRSHQN